MTLTHEYFFDKCLINDYRHKEIHYLKATLVETPSAFLAYLVGFLEDSDQKTISVKLVETNFFLPTFSRNQKTTKQQDVP